MEEQTIRELQKRINDGAKIKEFLGSEMWLDFIKPILDSMVKGLVNARDIDISSDKKAAIEVKSRTLAADYIEKVEGLLLAAIDDGKEAERAMTPKSNRDSPVKRY